MADRPTFKVFDAFKAVDANNDGNINKFELKQAIEQYGFVTTEDEI